jgi:hypothetical protein
MMQLDSQNWSCRPPRTGTCQLVDRDGNSLCNASFETTGQNRRYCDVHLNQSGREKAKGAARNARQLADSQGREHEVELNDPGVPAKVEGANSKVFRIMNATVVG